MERRITLRWKRKGKQQQMRLDKQCMRAIKVKIQMLKFLIFPSFFTPLLQHISSFLIQMHDNLKLEVKWIGSPLFPFVTFDAGWPQNIHEIFDLLVSFFPLSFGEWLCSPGHTYCDWSFLSCHLFYSCMYGTEHFNGFHEHQNDRGFLFKFLW